MNFRPTGETVLVGPIAEVLLQAKERGVVVRRLVVATDIWKSFEGCFSSLPRAEGEHLWGELEIAHNAWLPEGYASASGTATVTEHDVQRALFAARRMNAGGQRA